MAADITIAAGALPRVLAAHAGRHRPGVVLPDHRHAHWVLDYLIAGRMRWHRNGGEQPLLPGHAYLYRPDDIAGGAVEGRETVRFFGIVFAWEGLDRGRGVASIAPVTMVPEDERAEVEAAGAAIVDWSLGGRPGWDIAAGGRLAAILALLATLRAAPPTPASGDPLARRLSRAATFLRASLRRPFRIAEAAAAAGMSEAHFRAAFARRYGSSPLKYANELRLLELRRLLAHQPALRIAEAGARVGFADPRHAGRLFKRRFGQTPDDYRRTLPEAWWSRS